MNVITIIGRHFCLYCLITSDSYIPEENRPVVQSWTLESIKNDHQNFLEASGDIQRAKEFNNCPVEAIFDIPQ